MIAKATAAWPRPSARSALSRVGRGVDGGAQGHHGNQEDGGELGDAGQAEDDRAQDEGAGAGCFQVAPPRADRGQHEERDADVGRRVAAVREEGGAEGEEGEGNEAARRAEEAARPQEDERADGHAEERGHRARAHQHREMVLARLVEELVAHDPDVALPPVGLVELRERPPVDHGRERDPALRQVPVLRLQAVVVKRPVGEAARHVRDLVGRGALVALAPDGHREMQPEEERDPRDRAGAEARQVHGAGSGP